VLSVSVLYNQEPCVDLLQSSVCTLCDELNSVRARVYLSTLVTAAVIAACQSLLACVTVDMLREVRTAIQMLSARNVCG